MQSKAKNMFLGDKNQQRIKELGLSDSQNLCMTLVKFYVMYTLSERFTPSYPQYKMFSKSIQALVNKGILKPVEYLDYELTELGSSLFMPANESRHV